MAETYDDGYAQIADALAQAYNLIKAVTWPYGGSVFQYAVMEHLQRMHKEAIGKISDEYFQGPMGTTDIQSPD